MDFAARVNLCLHHGNLPAESFRNVDGFSRGERDLAARNGNPEARQHCFSLILVDFHWRVVCKRNSLSS